MNAIARGNQHIAGFGEVGFVADLAVAGSGLLLKKVRVQDLAVFRLEAERPLQVKFVRVPLEQGFRGSVTTMY